MVQKNLFRHYRLNKTTGILKLLICIPTIKKNLSLGHPAFRLPWKRRTRMKAVRRTSLPSIIPKAVDLK